MGTMSMRPDDWSEGGGLIDDVDVVWEEVEFCMWDYDGKVAAAVPALMVKMSEVDSGDEHVQYYSAGKASDWEPSEDGKSLEAIGKATSLNKGSNVAILIQSLIKAGFDADSIGDDVSVFEGVRCHMVRVDAPERKGLAPKLDSKGNVIKQTVLVVDSLLEEEKASKKKGGKKGTAKKAAAKEEEEESDEEGGAAEKATAAIMEVIAEEGAMKKKDLAGKVFQVLKKDPDRNEAVKLCMSDEFLGEGPWEFNEKKGIVG